MRIAIWELCAPFTLDSASQFLTRGPRRLDSHAHAREYDEVKSRGSLAGSSRTPDEQALAEFYTVAPAVILLPGLRTVTELQGSTVAEEARFHALVNVATADALMACWFEKEHWSFWRPVTANWVFSNYFRRA